MNEDSKLENREKPWTRGFPKVWTWPGTWLGKLSKEVSVASEATEGWSSVWKKRGIKNTSVSLARMHLKTLFQKKKMCKIVLWNLKINISKFES